MSKKNLKIYDKLRQFHKNDLMELLDIVDLSGAEFNALEALSGVLYLAEGVFCIEDKE